MNVLWLTLNVREAFLQDILLEALFSYKQHQAEIGKKPGKC